MQKEMQANTNANKVGSGCEYFSSYTYTSWCVAAIIFISVIVSQENHTYVAVLTPGSLIFPELSDLPILAQISFLLICDDVLRHADREDPVAILDKHRIASKYEQLSY